MKLPQTLDMILQHPLWSKLFAGLIATAVTGTLAFAMNTRDTVREHEVRLQNVEKAIEAVPQMSRDIAVLRDRSDRENGAK